MQAVILAGGQGTRLRPLTYKNPKPMVKINGRPFIDYHLDILKKNGIGEVVLLVGYLSNKFIDYLGDGSGAGFSVKYSIGNLEDNNGTRLRKAKDLLDDKFLLKRQTMTVA